MYSPLLLLLISLSVPTSKAYYDEKEASKLLHAISQKRSLQATFAYTYQLPQAPEAVPVEGHIAMEGQQYRLTTNEQVVFHDGKTIWTYLPAAKEVQIMNQAPEQHYTTPWDILHCYNQDYQVKCCHTQVISEHTYIVITLVAQDSEHPLPQVTLTIEPRTQHLKYLIAVDNHEATHHFDITYFTYNIVFKKGFFTFDLGEHKGIEVIDMR